MCRPKIRAVPARRDSDEFTDLERLVLEYAEAMTDTPPGVTDEMAERLGRELSEAELVELTAIVAVENLRSRMNAALGLTAQGFRTGAKPRPRARPRRLAGKARERPENRLVVVEVEAAEVVAAARRVLTTVPYGFFTTLGTTRPSVRMVGCLGIDEDLRVTFGTGRHTRKAAELRANATAIYAAADLTTGAAVCLYGTAALDEDLSRRRSAWVPGLARFVPGGPEDPEFVLVSIDPDRIEVWSEQDRVQPDPFGMASAVVLRSADGWAGPTTTHPGR